MYRAATSNSPTQTATKAKPISGAEVADHALSWRDTPWCHEGRTRFGIDCVGLVVVSAWHVGAPYVGYNYVGYARRPAKNILLGEFRKQMIEIPRHLEEPGTVLIFDQEGYAPYHVAIQLRPGEMVHAYLPARKTIADEIARRRFSLELTHRFAYKGVRYSWDV